MSLNFPACNLATSRIQHKGKRVVIYIAILTISISSAIFSRSLVATSAAISKTRNIKSTDKNQGLPSWALNNARPLRATSRVGKEVSLFWHIPKSGGTTVKKIYECLGQTLATAAGKGRRFIPDNNQIVVFNPYGTGNYVNVDTSSREGLKRAAEMKLVQSGKADLIFTTDVKFAVETLFDKDHQGRLFALFRHPIHRLVSKFYYMQSAVWERSYDPKLKDMTLIDWATSYNTDNNFFLQKLSGKKYFQLKERDLREAMRILRKRFIVGLTDHMSESTRRFNIVMGIDYMSENNAECLSTYFGGDEEKKENSHSHPSITEGSPEWNMLLSKNSLDVKLYEYVVDLFAMQKDVINDFTMQHLFHLEKKVTDLFDLVERRKKPNNGNGNTK